MQNEMSSAPNHEHGPIRVPSKGERIELVATKMGVRRQGTVYYSDDRQILVKWDDGRSESLRPGVDVYRILE